MKTIQLKISIALLAVGLAIAGCSKKKNPNQPDFTDEQIEQTYQKIKLTADPILLSEDPIAGFEAMAEEYRKMEEVKVVEVTNEGMFIKFENGELVGWYTPMYIEVQHADLYSLQKVSHHQKSAIRLTSNQKYALLLNQQSMERRPQNDYFLQNLTFRFTEAGWKYNQLVASDITVDFLKGIDIDDKGGKSIADYDAIYFIAHGFAADHKTWIVTGEEVEKQENKGSEPELVCRVNYLEKDIEDGAIRTSASEKYAFSGDFIRTYYQQGDFTNACIYMVACQSMGSNGNADYSMAQAFTDHGKASVYIGWDESNYSGQESGYYLYQKLLEGKTLSEAFDFLHHYPATQRYFYNKNILIDGFQLDELLYIEDLKGLDSDADYNPQMNIATLRYHPASASDFRLVERPSVDPETGLTEDIQNLVPEEIVNAMQDLGLPLNGGNTPPLIEGTYKIQPVVLKGTNIANDFAIGHTFTPVYITFSQQNNGNLTLKADETAGTSVSTGTGAFIVGEGDRFSVFINFTTTHTETNTTSKVVEVYSGTVSPDGIRDCTFSLFMVDDGGDPYNNLIENGSGRVFWDTDGLSERVTSAPQSIQKQSAKSGHVDIITPSMRKK
jgi:hypothetical protein